MAYGRVQGVFFRDTARRLPQSRGLGGWVRNAPEGTVEAVFEGEAAAVDALVRVRPRDHAALSVQRVEVTRGGARGAGGFGVR